MALICSLGTSLCSLPLDSVVESFRPLPVEPFSGAPDFVLGIAIVRGAPVPVLDLARLVRGRPGLPTRFVVLKAGERRVALAVDDVVGVRPVAVERLAELPPLLGDADTATVSAVGMLDSALFLVLQGSRIVPENFFEGEMAARLAS
jgi:purine-binding chemotaxis protein CheW